MPNLLGALGAAMYATVAGRIAAPDPAPPPPSPPAPAPLPHPGERLNQGEHARLRLAADRATRVYPGPVGQLLSRELLSWDEFGYRFGDSGFIFGVVADIEGRAVPTAIA